MDNLTHGLLGLAVGALRRPDKGGGRTSTTDRAVLLGCVIAAELPDIDSVILFTDPVHHALVAHRGWTHSLLAAPLLALATAAVLRFFMRSARFAPVFVWSLVSIVFAHLFADLWTGWGTRLLLPFSDARLLLDWTMVIDPWITLPLLAGAVASLIYYRRGRSWRQPLLVALTAVCLYLGARVAVHHVLTKEVQRSYPTAEVTVFPKLLAVLEWRYVATTSEEHIVGAIRVGRGGPIEQARHARPAHDSILEAITDIDVVRDALGWARFPVVDVRSRGSGETEVQISDLRYHLNGEPTLGFLITIDPNGNVLDAKQVRGGSPRELIERMRGREDAAVEERG